jgi:hypothetical protein
MYVWWCTFMENSTSIKRKALQNLHPVDMLFFHISTKIRSQKKLHIFRRSIHFRAVSTGLRAGSSGVRVPTGAENFSLHHRVKFGSGAHPAGGWVPGALSLRVKRLGRKADHLQLVQRSRMCGAIPPLPPYAFMAWSSVKAQGQLYFYFTLTRRDVSVVPISDVWMPACWYLWW